MPMNFLVWRRGFAGPTASLDLMDPRQSVDWPLLQQQIITIITLPPAQQNFTLAEAIAAHPCPPYEASA